MSAITEAFLDDLTPEQLAQLAERLRPYLDQHRGEYLLTPAEAATRLGLHVKTITRAAAAGRVRGAVRVGRVWRFRPDELALDPPAHVSPAPAPATRPRPGTSSAATAIRGNR